MCVQHSTLMVHGKVFYKLYEMYKIVHIWDTLCHYAMLPIKYPGFMTVKNNFMTEQCFIVTVTKHVHKH